MIPGIVSKLSESSVASTTTISLTSDLTIITGSTAIATINPAQLSFSGIAMFVPTDSTVALVTTGNIALAVTMASNQVTVLVYSKANSKWYPGAIS